jgi:drug/metabolite transporter (DMT)-like permease
MFLLVFASVSLNALAQIALRKGMLILGPLDGLAKSLPHAAMAAAGNPYLWAGMACYGLSIGSWLVVLSRLQVSLAYPMLSLGYIIATGLGFLLLGEQPSLMRLLAIGVICLGVFMISRTA